MNHNNQTSSTSEKNRKLSKYDREEWIERNANKIDKKRLRQTKTSNQKAKHFNNHIGDINE